MKQYGDGVIIEYADPPRCGYRRNELGAVVNSGCGEARERLLKECGRSSEAKDAIDKLERVVGDLKDGGATIESVVEFVRLWAVDWDLW
jgi:hypothetical protein